MTKECVIKDLFGILVIVIVNVTNHVTCKNCKCRKKIVGELVEECSKSIDENKIVYNKTFNVSVGDYKYTIHSIICGNFNNKCNNWWCFYLLSLLFKKKSQSFIASINEVY